MRLTENAIAWGEKLPLPDAVTRAAIRALVARTATALGRALPDADARFAAAMEGEPIARNTGEANDQHYELPEAFFGHVLGPQRKYSCCLFADAGRSLADAEEHALQQTAVNAALADGQAILELGCGWGSLSLWMARRYPAARITAVSNAHAQRRFILERAQAEGLTNLTVLTVDMNTFMPSGRFDRIVSIEMFEHMANWRALLTRLRNALAPEGRLFIHVFTHRRTPYRFDTEDRSDWIAQHFFTGGIMPSRGLIGAFGDLFAIEDAWTWSGTHYARTAEAWLANMDARQDAVDAVLRQVYGAEAALWRRRWRLFFMATAGLFGHAGGEVWGVDHYRLAPQ